MNRKRTQRQNQKGGFVYTSKSLPRIPRTSKRSTRKTKSKRSTRKTKSII